MTRYKNDSVSKEDESSKRLDKVHSVKDWVGRWFSNFTTLCQSRIAENLAIINNSSNNNNTATESG